MFKTEIYRIFLRKFVIAAAVLCFCVTFLYGTMPVHEEIVIHEGEIFCQENSRIAVAKDKEIAAEYTGYLTEETVLNIWERYGAPCRYENGVDGDTLMKALEAGGSYNYCNRIVARLFCDAEEAEDGTVQYRLKENLSESPFLQGNYYFGYVGGGWEWYWDSFLTVFVLTCLIIIVATAPAFSEDYMCRTVNCILPTVKGRLSLWKNRTLAGCLFASAVYLLMTGTLFVQQICFYGTGAWRVSCGLTAVPMFWQQNAEPLWKALLFAHLCGWFSVIVLTLVVQGLSARCRQTFSTVLWSLAFYAGPFALMRILLDNLPMGRLNRLLHQLIYSMPFSYAGMMLNAPPNWRRLMTGFALAAAFLGVFLGARSWCRHQVEN